MLCIYRINGLLENRPLLTNNKWIKHIYFFPILIITAFCVHVVGYSLDMKEGIRV